RVSFPRWLEKPRKRQSRPRRWPLGPEVGRSEMKPRAFSSPPPKPSADHLTKAGELPGKPPAQQKATAVVIQTEAARKPDGPVRRKIPSDCGRKIMRRVVQSNTLRVAQAAVH